MFLKPVFPVFEYVVNYDYIANVLCVNKAKPEMKCNGKCHLMKELAKASDAETPSSQDKKTLHQEIEVLFLEKMIVFQFSPVSSFEQEKEINSNYSNLYFQENSFSIFHPPTV
nr:hypothetical protein [Flavobacterium sp.]